METMYPELPDFEIEAVEWQNDGFTVTARATAEGRNCPKCGEISKGVHSWYERQPADLPSIGRLVTLQLKVRRFFCRNEECEVKIFCERVPEVVSWYSRRTGRQVQSLTEIGCELGGKAGSRLARKQGMPASRDTLLRLVRKSAEIEQPAPEVIGVDDWAFCKGQRYGTLICDHESGRVIDLLPERDAKTLADWLEHHPTVRIVTRDRSASYSAGASEGAPDATQIADRWHLANNLVDALEKTLAKQPGRLLGSTMTDDAPQIMQTEFVKTGEQVQLTVREDAQLAQMATRTRRLAQYAQILQLCQSKVSVNTIASQVGLSTKTVQRWLAHGSFPERQKRSVGATLLEAHHDYLHQRWNEGCHNYVELHRELQQRGYGGSYGTVCGYMRQLAKATLVRDEHNATSETTAGTDPLTLPVPRRRYSPRQVAFLFIQQLTKLSDTKAADLAILLEERPALQSVYDLAQQFMSLLRQRDLPTLNRWLASVAEIGSGSLKRFAAGLRRDYSEVSAAFLYHYSNGRTEGFVNKLKLLKRQMFGRAKLDLLRKRMIYLTQ